MARLGGMYGPISHSMGRVPSLCSVVSSCCDWEGLGGRFLSACAKQKQLNSSTDIRNFTAGKDGNENLARKPYHSPGKSRWQA